MKKLIIASLISLSCVAEAMTEKSVIDPITLELYKTQLPASLKAFVTDFETWSKEDRAKISIHDLSFKISGLSAEKQTPYDGCIGLWIDCRTQTQMQRVSLIACLKYLQAE